MFILVGFFLFSGFAVTEVERFQTRGRPVSIENGTPCGYLSFEDNKIMTNSSSDGAMTDRSLTNKKALHDQRDWLRGYAFEHW